LLPVIVTVSVPPAGPEFGLIAVSVGATPTTAISDGSPQAVETAW